MNSTARIKADIQQVGFIPPLVKKATAWFSHDELYRFELTMELEKNPRRWVLFTLLNPSTATAFKVDPTVRRCIGYAMQWKFDGLMIANAFAYRSTKRAALRTVDNPVGEGNDKYIVSMAQRADLVVCGWGNDGALFGRSAGVLRVLREAGVRPKALAVTKAGEPGHPLYLKGKLRPKFL